MCKINGKKLGELRTKAGISQKQLASEMGLSTSAIKNYEHGTSNPSDDKVDRICMILKNLICKKEQRALLSLSTISIGFSNKPINDSNTLVKVCKRWYGKMIRAVKNCDFGVPACGFECRCYFY